MDMNNGPELEERHVPLSPSLPAPLALFHPSRFGMWMRGKKGHVDVDARATFPFGSQVQIPPLLGGERKWKPRNPQREHGDLSDMQDREGALFVSCLLVTLLFFN